MFTLRLVSYVLSFFLIFGFIVSIYTKLVKREDESFKIISISIFGKIKEKTIVLICFISIITALFGNEGFMVGIVGVRSLKTMINGRYCYNAVMTDLDHYTNTLPVQIKIESTGEEKIILLEAVNVIDDYVVYFDRERIDPVFKSYVSDENGDEWEIEMTNDMAESKYLQYENNIIKNAIPSLILLAIQLLAALYFLIVVMTHHNEDKTDTNTTN